MSNKDRVFIAVYTRPGSSELDSLSPTRSKPKPQNYRWGIWVEPKNSTGAGTSFDLEDSVAYSSVTNPFGWRFHFDDHKSPPPRMLGRIMIGKLPEGMSVTDVTNILKRVPLPCDPGSAITDVVMWIKAVIEELQEAGYAETFSIETFMGDALAFATTWHSRNSRDIEKVNYTWSRAFP
ncbi:uncharacterized protein BDR25DRAFT_307131 [Lindgomyces ingoldianus]|uniref:Uncharacterized protein n=1 Tax=Lindgomyces ingoldianus TaxID=673940 RepID=A0ACB6QE10_9PLEO|nr:uncharacterized protein BDR25DRAFT_307131 [Lindgomyces ingoldianus]KAF2464592.1 hypothetical protein BDR25DRAFT_307131 [Lindgomyces ingoldianus]